MSKRPKGADLLSNQILLCLAERPQSHPELSYMLKRTIGCIRTVNNMNRSLDYIEPIGKSMNRAAGPVRWRLTKHGQEHVRILQENVQRVRASA